MARQPKSGRGQKPPEQGFFAQVYALVEQIPPGRVATYGQVAALLGTPRAARAVGWALRALGESRAAEVPWHRVVGAGGRISLRGGSGPVEQRRRLRAEGVRFRNARIDLTRYGVLQGRRERAPEGSGRENTARHAATPRRPTQQT